MNVENVQLIINTISTLGFPIVCCYFMWQYINTTLKDFTKVMDENTKMLSLLCERMRKDDNE